MKSPSRIKVTAEEANLLFRYREQCRTFNEGIAAALALVVEEHRVQAATETPATKEDIDQFFSELEVDIAKLRKDHG